jgi:hypothetical protein
MKNKDIEKAIRRICITKTQYEATDAKMDKQTLSDALAAYDNSKNIKSIIFKTDIWGIIMKSQITKIAAAAVIIVICFKGLHFWKSTGSGIALADVLAAVEKVTGFTYKIDAVVTIQGNSTNSTSTVLVSKDYGAKNIGKVIDPNTGKVTRQESYFLTQSNSHIWFNHDEKTYHRLKFEDTTSQNNNKEEYEELNNPETIIKQFLSCDHISLGQSKIDGITVEGFQTTDPAYKQVFSKLGSAFPIIAERINVKIWVDVKTFLPVRSEQEIITRSGIRIYYVTNDFHWNVEVDASDFEPNIPDDYTNPAGIVTLDFTEKNAIEGLKLFADLAKHYPADPNGTNFIDQIRDFIDYNDGSWEDLSEDEKNRRNNDILKPLVGFAVFYKGLIYENKNPAYYGEIVKPGDANEVQVRWKLDDSQYRVIFGDLSVKTVTAAELADLEKP